MSRRIQGRGNIKRPENEQYINTKYLPYDRTINSVHYYNRRRHQLKANPQNEPNQHNDRMQFKNQLSTLVNGKKNDANFSNHLKQVQVEPVANNKILINFSEEMYPLLPQDKVRVVDEERQFRLQSYFTYFYQQEMKKQVNKFANQTQEKVIEAVNQKPFSEQGEHFEDEPSRNKSNISKYQSKVRNKAVVNELVPVHIDYSGNNYQPNLLFTVKQNQRLQISRRR